MSKMLIAIVIVSVAAVSAFAVEKPTQIVPESAVKSSIAEDEKAKPTEAICNLDEDALRDGVIKVYVNVENLKGNVNMGINGMDVICMFEDFLKKK